MLLFCLFQGLLCGLAAALNTCLPLHRNELITDDLFGFITMEKLLKGALHATTVSICTLAFQGSELEDWDPMSNVVSPHGSSVQRIPSRPLQLMARLQSRCIAPG